MSASTTGEAEPIMISALEHYSYCPRQCALIHIEQTFRENVFTLRGSYQHARVDREETENRPGIRREYAVPLWSDQLGLVGRADVIEFTAEGPFPIEHKSSKRRQWGHEEIQLCAQALCLEEMLGQPVLRGAIYYQGSRVRREIEFDATLRQQVIETIKATRRMLDNEQLPPPINDNRCRHCAQRETCMPQISANRRHERVVMARLFAIDRSRDDLLPTTREHS